MSKRVFLATKDLMFRSKLGATVVAAGAEVVKDPAGCDLVVVDVESPGAVDRIRGFVTSGTPVIAYGSHVLADLLRAARDAGATAVPNSEVERRLRAWVIA
jgi:ribulose 1,5-bisphosphate synthetase/thiazole synthase